MRPRLYTLTHRSPYMYNTIFLFLAGLNETSQLGFTKFATTQRLQMALMGTEYRLSLSRVR